jgi:hypothetical protein
MFRFTIRDLLWLMTLVAVILVSYVKHEKQTAAYRRLKIELQDTQANAGISQYNAESRKAFIKSAYHCRSTQLQNELSRELN